MIRRHFDVAHVARHELYSTMQDEAVAEFCGVPTRVKPKGRTNWCDAYWVRTDAGKRSIGGEMSNLRDRLDCFTSLKADKAERRRDRARLIRILRTEGPKLRESLELTLGRTPETRARFDSTIPRPELDV